MVEDVAAHVVEFRSVAPDRALEGVAGFLVDMSQALGSHGLQVSRLPSLSFAAGKESVQEPASLAASSS